MEEITITKNEFNIWFDIVLDILTEEQLFELERRLELIKKRMLERENA